MPSLWKKQYGMVLLCHIVDSEGALGVVTWGRGITGMRGGRHGPVVASELWNLICLPQTVRAWLVS